MKWYFIEGLPDQPWKNISTQGKKTQPQHLTIHFSYPRWKFRITGDTQSEQGTSRYPGMQI